MAVNPDTMKPLINSEGHVRALEDYVKFLADGPREEISWTLGQGWNLFLAGHSATEPTWRARARPEDLEGPGKDGRRADSRHHRGLQSDRRPMEEVPAQSDR